MNNKVIVIGLDGAFRQAQGTFHYINLFSF